MEKTCPINQTRQWLEEVVIGLNLCPFARKPFTAGQVRFAVSDSRNVETLLGDLHEELDHMDRVSAEEVDTTLLIITDQLDDFLDYNDVLDLADGLLEQQGWEGTYQIASFHPAYQFADTTADDPENYTNRAPYPILHILREASLDKGLASYPNPEQIPERNMATLNGLNEAQWQALFGGLPGAHR
ncbi:hypothetical protein Y017_05700 [Alcanivorax sp. 97CO-5]|jgi:hypothetical protein|nr:MULTISPECIES: DUF1415 domain-containing protein [unclassified Alcanivorax]EUC68261.1 hypothetical protein Y017_05700 [Alcanivorax sp. 97CO-5]PKG00628.1 DUF1415 domain-containing protein [Alcanivorax sp. 97CO-6]BAP14944.1 hypothetical protein AS19_20930 [Alcanivorax sp. NBRC 101098]